MALPPCSRRSAQRISLGVIECKYNRESRAIPAFGGQGVCPRAQGALAALGHSALSSIGRIGEQTRLDRETRKQVAVNPAHSGRSRALPGPDEDIREDTPAGPDGCHESGLRARGCSSVKNVKHPWAAARFFPSVACQAVT